MRNDGITLIITTRYFPSWWPDGERLDWDVNLLEISNNKEAFEKNPCAKTDSFGTYDVFVVPCLDKTASPEQKGEYLEKTLSLICPNREYKNVYLCAHDKDFNVDGDVYGNLVKKDNVPCDGCHQLMELLEMKHAYMFAHDEDKSAVGKIVMMINSGKFGENECASIIKIIDAEREMNDFFTSINANINTYPLAT